jgi:dihydrofolate reductase
MISLIAAMSENRVIGVDGGLPWRLPDDMKHFMQTTRGHTVIMGRKTWESMNGPLKDRCNIVITRQRDFVAPGAVVAHSLNQALHLAPESDQEVFIIGGEALFRDALPKADRLYLTIVHAHVEGDALLPDFDENDWRVVEERRHVADARHQFAFTIRRYDRVARVDD